jgi:hypothetical protein
MTYAALLEVIADRLQAGEEPAAIARELHCMARTVNRVQHRLEGSRVGEARCCEVGPRCWATRRENGEVSWAEVTRNLSELEQRLMLEGP